MSTHLLIVDDEVEIREMLQRHFTLADYAVMTASNGRNALDILEKNRVDIVITDLMMPEMDGITLLRKLRAESPTTHVIAITGYVTLENALACMRLGARTVVFKPLEDLTELEEAVGEAEASMMRWQRKLRELRGMRPKG